MKIGLISDTHGLLRPQALAALQGVERIIHAGDIGAGDILDQLARIAPVAAVRGNNDRGAWAQAIPERQSLRFGQVGILLLHDVKELRGKPDARVVIAGHSHKPRIEEKDGVLFINPGSAGPRRFKLPVTLGMLQIDGDAVSATIVELEV
jgi:putative phosphoesterase